MSFTISRRQLVGALSAAAACPLIAQAQQGDGRRARIGVLVDFAESDPQGRDRVGALRMGLQQLGWVEGQNLRIDYCWGADLARVGDCGSELVRLALDLIWTNGTTSTQSARRATDKIPIVFANVADPVGSAIVSSLASPGRNITGFANFEYPMGGKWLGMLRDISPGLSRFLFMHNAESEAAPGLAVAILDAGRSVGATITVRGVRDAADIERALAAFGREGGGLIVQPDGILASHRDLISGLALRYRLPGVYPFRYYATAGGLISYGVDLADIIRGSAQYVDRILKGEKPAELPVQFPTKFELVINLKTAKALGLTVPDRLLAAADDVIE